MPSIISGVFGINGVDTIGTDRHDDEATAREDLCKIAVSLVAGKHGLVIIARPVLREIEVRFDASRLRAMHDEDDWKDFRSA